MVVLVTGGAGFIGSHTCISLLLAGHDVVVLDNLSNSSSESLRRVQALAGRQLSFVPGDVRDMQTLREIFRKYRISAVIHLAGLKAVGESVELPLRYYSNNVSGTVCLCEAMETAGVYLLVFSSSCTVYGNPVNVPVSEDHPTGDTTNPYGRSKYIVERMLQDLCAANPRWDIALLRYFNPVGAHPSGQIGEDPRGVPNNLLPYICQVAVGRRERLQVFGNDYETKDGTGVRDYVHVMDLAEGHLAALNSFSLGNSKGFCAWNLGTGVGYSVMEVIKAFEIASGKSVPVKFVPRRPGDTASVYADPAKAKADLSWAATRDLNTMIRDAWHWQQKNPEGYNSPDS